MIWITTLNPQIVETPYYIHDHFVINLRATIEKNLNKYSVFFFGRNTAIWVLFSRWRLNRKILGRGRERKVLDNLERRRFFATNVFNEVSPVSDILCL